MCVFLTYQYGLRPKRQQYPRLEADPGRSAAVVQRSSQRVQPGLEQIALVRDARRSDQIVDDDTSL